MYVCFFFFFFFFPRGLGCLPAPGYYIDRLLLLDPHNQSKACEGADIKFSFVDDLHIKFILPRLAPGCTLFLTVDHNKCCLKNGGHQCIRSLVLLLKTSISKYSLKTSQCYEVNRFLKVDLIFLCIVPYMITLMQALMKARQTLAKTNCSTPFDKAPLFTRINT